MTASTVRAFAVVMLVLVQGCLVPVKRSGSGPKQLIPARGARSGGGSVTLFRGFGPKSIQEKRPPKRLVARDGTSCYVSEQKYASTALGESAWCIWLDTNQ
jgi:hypothetical protein